MHAFDKLKNEMVEKQNAYRSAAVQLTQPKLKQMLRAMFYDDVHDADDADADHVHHLHFM